MMGASLLLVRRHALHHRLRSLLLVFAFALTLVLPLTVEVLVERYSGSLLRRAQQTPLVLGAPGSRFDLVLDSLYFRGRTPEDLYLSEVVRLNGSGLGLAVPLQTRLSADSHPVVGTTPEYYELRELRVERGSLPLLLGDCVLGAELAELLGLGPGDELLTDRPRTFDLAAGYPMRLNVVGVLARAGSADDGAVFCSLDTCWVGLGIGHGHQDAGELGDESVLGSEEQRVILNASVFEFTGFDEGNLSDFHMHVPEESLPLTAALVVPASDKGRTLLKGRYRVDQAVQLLTPTEVMDELLGVVFRLKVFFDANAVAVALATGLFLAVIVALSLAARRKELETLARIGCARATALRLVGLELLLLAAIGVVLAGGAALALVAWADRWLGLL